LNTDSPAAGLVAGTTVNPFELGGAVEALAVDSELRAGLETDLPTGFPFDVISYEKSD
jgi:hypothetical protein